MGTAAGKHKAVEEAEKRKGVVETNRACHISLLERGMHVYPL